MTEISNKIINEADNIVQFLGKDELPQELLDAQAALAANPYVRWGKFILTDDQPNGNNERTPLEEFDNIIQSGIYMPIKMAEGRIEEDHSDASPLGVITHLKKQVVEIAGKLVNQIVGLAAFWLRERPADVSYIKERIDNDQPVNLSWELGAQDKVLMPDGVFDWKGLAMQAVTVVGNPAYQGRTRIVAMAAKKPAKWSDEYIRNLPDTAFLYIERGGTQDAEGRTSQEKRHFPVKDDKGLYDEAKLREVLVEAGKTNLPTPVLKSLKKTVTALLDKIDAGASLEEISFGKTEQPKTSKDTEEHTVELEQLQKEILSLQEKLNAAEAALAEKTQLVETLTVEKTALASERDELKQFKDALDAEVAKANKLDAIKTKFAEASLDKGDDYFTANEEKLLAMDESTLEFMIQELAAFSKKDAEASQQKGKLPNLTNEGTGEVDIKELAKALKNRKSK